MNDPLVRDQLAATNTAPVGLAVSTRVVHCRRDRYDVYIGRPSKWGNPYVIGRDGTREQVIAKYRAWVLRRPELVAALSELRGKVLACWCAPQPCHGDVLVDLVQSGQEST
ncbi:MAG: DUF4326 domain-containing protein [Acidobacteriota bacterium]|nr:DUF4326 domain-containing protein [Acidobacteriota bacterium]